MATTTVRKISMVPKSFCDILINSQKLNHSVDEVQHILESAFNHIIETVKGGKKINFSNFVKFERNILKARVFKNPGGMKDPNSAPKEDIIKPARYSLKVTVMHQLREAFEKLAVVPESDTDTDAETKTNAIDENGNVIAEVKKKAVAVVKAKAVKTIAAATATATDTDTDTDTANAVGLDSATAVKVVKAVKAVNKGKGKAKVPAPAHAPGSDVIETTNVVASDANADADVENVVEKKKKAPVAKKAKPAENIVSQ